MLNRWDNFCDPNAYVGETIWGSSFEFGPGYAAGYGTGIDIYEFEDDYGVVCGQAEGCASTYTTQEGCGHNSISENKCGIGWGSGCAVNLMND